MVYANAGFSQLEVSKLTIQLTGFTCKVLFCVNYVRCCVIENFNSTVIKPGVHRPMAAACLVSYDCFCADVCMCGYVCMCVSTPEAINKQWHDMHPI